jgi:hypothetical protein
VSVITSPSPDYLTVVSTPITAMVDLRPTAAQPPSDRVTLRLQPAFALPNVARQIRIRGTSGDDNEAHRRSAWH